MDVILRHLETMVLGEKSNQETRALGVKGSQIERTGLLAYSNRDSIGYSLLLEIPCHGCSIAV